MESEKVKEIKKGLECCTNPVYCEKECPYHIYERHLECINELAKDSLTLTNELEKHIQNMENEVRRVKQDRNRKEELASKYMDVYNDSLKQFAERLKEKLEKYRLENEYFTEHEPNGNLWQMNSSVFCIEVTQDGGIVDETLKEFIGE